MKFKIETIMRRHFLEGRAQLFHRLIGQNEVMTQPQYAEIDSTNKSATITPKPLHLEVVTLHSGTTLTLIPLRILSRFGPRISE